MNDSPLSADDCRMFLTNNQWYCYIPITKVYSTYLRRALPANAFDIHRWQWYQSADPVPDPHSVQYVVVLRDPVERWVSGVTEFWCRARPEQSWSLSDNYDWLFDQIEFDVHTRPQVDFINICPHHQTHWLWAPNTGIQDHPWWNDHGVQLQPVDEIDRNHGNARPLIWFLNNQRFDHAVPGAVHSVPSQHIQHTLQWLLKQDCNREAVVRKHYQADYAVIESVPFYGRD